jgi:hypothetical protein
MADASHEPERFDPGHDDGSAAPQDWSNAFAALPMEAPPRDLWPTLAARMPAAPAAAPRRSRPWPYGIVLAASLCVLALGANALLSRLESTSDAAPVAQRTPAADATPAAPAPANTADAARSAIATTTAPATEMAAIATPASARALQTTPPRIEPPQTRPAHTAPQVATALPQRPRHRPQRHGPKRPLRTTPASGLTVPVERRMAERAPDAQTPSTALPTPAVTPSAPAASVATGSSLAALHAESATWEDLLQLTRDPRVGSGPSALLAGELDAALAQIDAALALPDLDAAEEARLWQARVDTLREAVRFETGVRTLASEGQRYEGALVDVD